MNTFRSRISPLPIIMAAIAFVAAWAIVATVPSSAQTEQQPWQMAVTGLAVAPGDAPGELHITWDAHPENPNNYRVNWTAQDDEFADFRDSDWNAFLEATTHTVTGLTPGGQYKARVRARFGNNQRSDWSEVDTGYAGAAPTPQPMPEADTEPTPEPTPGPTNVDATVGDDEDACPRDGDAPTPTAVAVPAVPAVPIVVTSTTDDYFVLYVNFDVYGETVETPVLVTLGEAGTTTLAENVEELPAERYRVEKYLVADPADVDGDCIDDVTELTAGDPVANNPVNPADGSSLGDDLSDGAVAIPDQTTFDTLAFDFARRSYVKIILFGMDTDNPGVYFANTQKYLSHKPFRDAFAPDVDYPVNLTVSYSPDLVAPDGSMGAYYWSQHNDLSFSYAARVFAVLAANMPVLEDNLNL